MKKYLSIFVLLGTLILLSSCGYVYHFDQSNVQKTMITVWLDDGTPNHTWMKDEAAAFEAKNPNIIVNMASYGVTDAENKEQMFGPSGQGADVFEFPHDHLASALQNRLLQPFPADVAQTLNQTMDPTAMKIATACYDPSHNSLECTGTSTAQVYAAPIEIETVALYYNIDLLKQMITQASSYDWSAYGLTSNPTSYTQIIPTTFQELISLSDQYQAKNPNDFGFLTNFDDAYFMNFIWTAFGFEPFGPNHNDKSTPNIDTQPVIDGLQWMKDNLMPMYPAGDTNSGLQADTGNFDQGTLPFIITGPWMNQQYESEKINFGVTTIPTIDVNGTQVHPTSYMGDLMLGLTKYSTHPAAALKFIEFMASPVGEKIYYQDMKKLPALNQDGLKQIPGLATDNVLQGMIKQLQYTMPMPTIPEVQSYWGPMQTALENVWNNGMTPSAAAQAALNSYNALVAQQDKS